MATSVQYDSTELVNTTYVPRFVKHESVPERAVSSLKLARQDGEVIVSERYGVKKVTLTGYLIGTSQADLESKIDAFKELFSRMEKNLDIDWNSGTRRYVASCTGHTFDRDHFHILFVPWSAEFTVFSGEGKDTSTTTARNAFQLTTTTPATDSFTLAGSKPPLPKITLKGHSFATGENLGLEYKNTDTGEKIVVTRNKTWGLTDLVIIDCLLKKVTDDVGNGGGTPAEGTFYGVFPTWKIGTNNIQLTVGGVTNQSSDDVLATLSGGGQNINDTAQRYAQSFQVPYTDATFQGVTIGAYKTGTPGTMTWRIETDSSGKPSGTLVDGAATGSITASQFAVAGVQQYVTSYSSAPYSLTANTKYWLVLKAAATLDGSNEYTVSTTGGYLKGSGLYSTDSGSTYPTTTLGFAFRILYAGKGGSGSGVDHTVVYTKTYL